MSRHAGCILKGISKVQLKPWPLPLLAIGLLAGCGTKLGGKDFTDPSPAVVYSSATSQPAENTPTAQISTDPKKPPQPLRVTKATDPPPLVRPSVGLSLVQISVPVGAISRSEQFWKKIEERAIDIGTYDILQKNGIRVGIGAAGEIEALLRPFDRTQLKPQVATFIAANVKKVDLPLKQAIPEQTIYDFDLKDVLTVRTYEAADYFMSLEFAPAPRKAGDVRISICPLIRTLRKRLVQVTDINTQEIEFKNPEKFFNLHLQVDLPLDSFLIVAPSPQGHAAMSLGHSFLISSGETQQYETVLLITPQAMTVRPQSKPAGQ